MHCASSNDYSLNDEQKVEIFFLIILLKILFKNWNLNQDYTQLVNSSAKRYRYIGIIAMVRVNSKKKIFSRMSRDGHVM